MRLSLTWTCPECGTTFSDPNEYAYGHDCEASE